MLLKKSEAALGAGVGDAIVGVGVGGAPGCPPETTNSVKESAVSSNQVDVSFFSDTNPGP
jgi:hypothetical protein